MQLARQPSGVSMHPWLLSLPPPWEQAYYGQVACVPPGCFMSCCVGCHTHSAKCSPSTQSPSPLFCLPRLQFEALDMINCLICPIFFANMLSRWPKDFVTAVYGVVLAVKGYQLMLLVMPAARQHHAHPKARWVVLRAPRSRRAVQDTSSTRMQRQTDTPAALVALQAGRQCCG